MKKKIFLLVIVLLTGLSVFSYNSKYMRMYIYVNFMNEKSSLENYFFEDTFIPYRGSIYISNNILNSSDNSTFTSIESIPDNPRTMYDFRNNGSWIKITPFLFKAKFSDDSEIEVQVNSEFENKTNAEKIALIYFEEIGRLPKLFRKNLETVSIHKGYENFGGGNNNFVIHHDNGLELKKYGLLEEIFLHEGVHTSLDSDHGSSNGWINAQKADNGNFISDYAKQYPKREDLAETIPLCFALKYKRERLSDHTIKKIEKTIPNRIEYCDIVFEKMK